MEVSPLLFRFLERFGEAGGRPAYLDGAGNTALTWRGLLSEAAGLARWLERELAPEGSLVLACGNRPEYPVAFWAAMMCRRCVLPVSPQIPWDELQPMARRTQACAVIGEPESLEKWGKHFSIRLPLEQVRRFPADPAPVFRAGESARPGSMVLQSSGSTGLPKLVEKSFASLAAVGRNCAGALKLSADDRYLLAIPLYHSYAVDHGLMAAAESLCSVRLCRGFDLASIGEAIRAGGATVFPGVPFMFEILSQKQDLPADLGGLRCCFSAGAPLPAAVHEAFENRFGRRLGQIYGSTEFCSVTFNDPEEEPFDFSSVGRPMAGVQVRIADPENPARPCAAGDEGEISVAAPSAMSGYLGGEPGADEQGFIRTGDLGRVDGQGRLHVTGRLKLMADVGGMKVNLMEVEGVLRSHPAVREAVVAPLEISATTHRLQAWVVLREGVSADPESLREYLRGRLIAYKVPRQVEIRDDLPRSPSGKILRRELTA